MELNNNQALPPQWDQTSGIEHLAIYISWKLVVQWSFFLTSISADNFELNEKERKNVRNLISDI